MLRSVSLRAGTIVLLVPFFTSCGGLVTPRPLEYGAHVILAKAAASREQLAEASVDLKRAPRASRPTAPWTPTLKWSYTTPEPIYYSSPAIASDGTIYVGNGEWGMGGNGLYAFKPDGTLKWFFDNGTHNYMFTPVIGPDGTIYIQDAVSTLYAINPDGSQKWKYSLNASADVGQTAPAVVSSGIVYFGGDSLYAVDATGKLLWRATTLWGDTNLTYQIQYIRSSPAIGQDGTIYVGANGFSYGFISDVLKTFNGMLLALNPDGSRKWAYLIPSFVFSSPAIGQDGTIYIGSDNSGDVASVYAITPDGALKWTYDVIGGRAVRSSAAIATDGTIYIGAKSSTTGTGRQGAMLALTPSGSLLWEFPIPLSGADVYCSPTIGAGGLIYFGAESSQVYALYPDGTPAWTYQTNNGINWTSPAITSDGTLYIGNNAGTLFAIRTGSSGIETSVWAKFHENLGNTGVFPVMPPAPVGPSRPPRPAR